MDEYVSKKEVIEYISTWLNGSVLWSSVGQVVSHIEGLTTVKLDDIYCPSCGENLEELTEDYV